MKRNFRKRMVAFAMAAILSLSIAGTAAAAESEAYLTPVASGTAVSSVQPSATTPTLKIKVGQTMTLYLNTNYGKVSGSKMTNWKSSKKSVATVSKKGKVTAKKKGTTIISAKYKGRTYKAKIIVSNPSITGFSKMKTYIKSHGQNGVTNGVQFKVISKTDDGYTFMAVYFPSNDSIRFMTYAPNVEGVGDFSCDLSFPTEKGSTAKFQFEYEKDSNYFLADATLKRASFTKKTTPTFVVRRNNCTTDEYIQALGKEFLQLSFAYWEDLALQAGTSMYDFGFIRY